MAEVQEDPKSSTLGKLFLEKLHPCFVENGFVKSDENQFEMSQHRYKIAYQLSKINSRGQVTVFSVDIIGMPMASILVVFGKVQGDETMDVKVKIKASESADVISRRIKTELVDKLIESMSLKLSDLPLEIKTKLMCYLAVYDVKNMMVTSKEWKDFCTSEDLIWKNLYHRDFKKIEPYKSEDMTWREVYRRVFIKRRQEHDEASQRECWRVRGLPGPPPVPMLPGLPPRLAIGPPHHIFPVPYPNFQPEPDIFPPFSPFARPRGPFGGGAGGFF
ncbi:hypothetical protein HDE_08859 [Halotydeus destructor]|nr:hypothetical protein HDE_08859 [Halotydeus destructor]